MALNIIINKVSVAASFAAGATVATAVASGGTAPYIYSLATGGDKFAINSSTGVVTTIAAMDINNIASFSVTATDSTTGTALTGTSSVTYPPIQSAIQNRFNKPNTIYKVTKDITLSEGTLTIPEGCTLDFQGGSFTNGTIIFNNTKLKNCTINNFSNSIKVDGIIYNDTIEVDWFGVYKDGINDDAVAIRKVLKLLENKKGGILQLNSGTYYCNSGDSSFANGNYNPVLQWQNVNEYYSCFRVVNNVTVQGVGNSTVILINQDRLGNRTMGGNFRIAPALFSNYLQRVGYLLSGKFVLQNLKIVGKNNGNSPYPYSNGNIIEVYNSLGSDPTDNNCPGEIIMDRVTTENIVGYAHINVTNILNIEFTNCVCTKFGKEADSKTMDYSIIFSNAINTLVNNCLFKLSNLAVDYTSTAIELHSNNAIISNNTCLNVNKFCNLCGSPNSRTPSNYIVANNVATVNIFTNPYVFSYKSIDTIKLNNNNVTLYYNKDNLNSYYPTFSRVLMINETESVIVPIKKYIIENNIVSLAELGGAGLTNFAYGILNDVGIEEFFMRGNSLHGLLGALGQFNSTLAKVREFTNNSIIGFLTKVVPNSDEKYLLYLTQGTTKNSLNCNISNNTIINTTDDSSLGFLYLNLYGDSSKFDNDTYLISDNITTNIVTPFAKNNSSSSIEKPVVILRHDEVIGNKHNYNTTYDNLNSLKEYLMEGSYYKIFKDNVYYTKKHISSTRSIISGEALGVPTVYTPIIAGAIIKDSLSANRYFYCVENSFKPLYNYYYGPSSDRINDLIIGQTMFDTTLNKPIWWSGSNWVDATGAAV